VTVQTLLGDGGTLSHVLPAYERRPEQLAMAEAVEQALASNGHLLVEAGTGTGKSLAYLVPAARSGLRVVISTATKTLGEQLVQRDIPTLAYLDLHPEVALVKGLGNYVCMRRLEDHRRAVVTGAAKQDAHFTSVLDWLDDTPTGDRADLASVPDDAPVWRDISSSSETRVGMKCRYYNACFVTRMKRRAENAQLIITNHHLFCADLALRSIGFGAQALPDYDAVIFDEAHALEEVATEFFGVRVTRARVETLVRDAVRAFELSGLFADRERASGVVRSATVIAAAAQRMFNSLPRASEGGGRSLLSPRAFEGALGEATHQMRDALADLSGVVEQFVDENEALLGLHRRVRQLRDALDVIRNGDSPSHVAYCDPDARGGGALGASPVEVGPLLAEQLWARRGAVVLTSATLATKGERGFGFIRKRLGVPDAANELALASPFDFGAQAALYVPRQIPEPRAEGYFEAAADEIRKLVAVTQGGAFVLCTSVRQMRAFASEFRGTWPYPTWVQGEAPKNALLSRFRDAGNAVLLATSSFWEGVDIPGHALRLVVIDKLPFDAPNDPVVSARIQRMREQGHEPFAEYQLPAAALALKQGFGRLIRTRRDAGIVAILDRRLLTRGYGKRMLAALPAASRCASIEELAAFWAHVSESAAV
jgi:ATP-dependent DNA helicase DinG